MKQGVSCVARLIINIFLVFSSSIIFAMQHSSADSVALPIPPVNRPVAEPVAVREMADYFCDCCLFFAAPGDKECCANIMFLREFDLGEVMLLIDQGGSIADGFKIALRKKGFKKTTVQAKRSIERIYSKVLRILGAQECESDDELDGERPVDRRCGALVAAYKQRKAAPCAIGLNKN